MTTMESLASLAERQFGLVTFDELVANGVGQRRISRWVVSGRVVRVDRGVFRLAGAPLSFEGRVLAAILVFGPESWASHRTAAAVWGLQGFGEHDRIELTRPLGTSNQRASARVHRSAVLPSHHVTVHRGVPVTTLSRTLFDLARSMPRAPLDRVVEDALRTRWCTIGSLYRLLGDLGSRGRPGIARMRATLETRGTGYVPTESELDLVGRSVLAPVDGIDWQVELSDDQGYIRRVDGFHRASRLVIEWDGAAFHDAPAQHDLDRAGDLRLERLGLTVLRYRWADVTLRPSEVLSEVVAHVGASSTSPLRT